MSLFNLFDIYTKSKKTSSVEDICKKFDIWDYTINEDGSIDVDGDVILSDDKFSKFPLSFGKVSGGFSCISRGLESLEGAPKHVGENFQCLYNNLTSLEGGPKFVEGEYFCAGNKITSFKGFPDHVGDRLLCYNNPIHEIYRLNSCMEFVEFLNEYDVIRDGNRIVETRLRQALEDSNCGSIPKMFEFRNYEVI